MSNMILFVCRLFLLVVHLSLPPLSINLLLLRLLENAHWCGIVVHGVFARVKVGCRTVVVSTQG